MKKLLCLAFACALALGSVQPVSAKEDVTLTQRTDVHAIKNSSMDTLQGYTDPFYALSLLADGASEEEMKKMESTILKDLEAAATAGRSTSQDIEKLILLAEGLGFDSTAYVCDGKTHNLFDMLAEKKLTLVNDYTYALEALHSAGFPDVSGKSLHKDTLIHNLLSLRNPLDHAWNYNADYSGDYGFSDPDTTAMVLHALAPYSLQSAESMGISIETKTAVDAAVNDAFAYLSGKQGVSGAMDNGFGENACTTSMVIVALGAYGKDVITDSQFVKEGNTLADGLMSFKSKNQDGFEAADWMSGEMKLDLFTTEQALRALIVIEHNAAGSPYNLYQEGAVKNQNRFVIEDTETETEDQTLKEENTSDDKSQEKEKEEESNDVIKNTAENAKVSISGLLIMMAGAGYFFVRRYAE